MTLEEILSQIEKLKMDIKLGTFTVSDLETIRREVLRLEAVVYDKILEVQTPQNHTKTVIVYSCSICGTEFLNKRSVMTHIIRHHHLKPTDDLIVVLRR